jgi:4-carboxymuconolactone decarboxylase
VHEPAARNAGLDEPIIEAIRHGRTPSFAGGNDQLVYDVTKELCETRTVSDATYQRATAVLGTELLIELITVIGFYTIAAMVINTFDAPVPNGARPLA